MDKYNKSSRTNKFEKRRKNTKLISILMIISAVLLIVLIGVWIFGGKEKQAIAPNENSPNSQDNNENNEGLKNEIEITENNDPTESTEEKRDNEEEVIDESEDNTNENTDINDTPETEPVDPSDDNVKIAYRGDWKPIGTEQTGPHTTTYDEESADRNEMEQAIKMVTGLDQMITWWLQNGGDQKVIATVSDTNQIDIYRVYLSWIDNEGWQPTKVEELIENDKKKN